MIKEKGGQLRLSAFLLRSEELEDEGTVQLDETRRGIAAACRTEDAGRSSDRALDRAERTVLVARRKLVRRVLEVRVVEEVEELCTDLQLHNLRVRNRNRLEGTEVHVGVCRPDDAVAALLSEVGWWGERINKVALVRHAAVRKESMCAATATVIEVVVELVCEEENGAVGEGRATPSNAAEALGDGVRQARLMEDASTGLEAARDGLPYTTAIGRKLVYEGCCGVLLHVIVGEAVVGVKIGRIRYR
jgi:hypothetical protein